MARLAPALRIALESWDKRIPTGQLNSWLTDVVAQTPPPPRGGKAPKVLFVTQADTRPPRFVVFTSGFLEAGYRRFLERKLREDFGFEGTPIEISVTCAGEASPLRGRSVARSPCSRVSGARADAQAGLWRSLVAHLTGGQGVAGSNPVSPTHGAWSLRRNG